MIVNARIAELEKKLKKETRKKLEWKGFAKNLEREKESLLAQIHKLKCIPLKDLISSANAMRQDFGLEPLTCGSCGCKEAIMRKLKDDPPLITNWAESPCVEPDRRISELEDELETLLEMVKEKDFVIETRDATISELRARINENQTAPGVLAKAKYFTRESLCEIIRKLDSNEFL